MNKYWLENCLKTWLESKEAIWRAIYFKRDWLPISNCKHLITLGHSPISNLLKKVRILRKIKLKTTISNEDLLWPGRKLICLWIWIPMNRLQSTNDKWTHHEEQIGIKTNQKSGSSLELTLGKDRGSWWKESRLK